MTTVKIKARFKQSFLLVFVICVVLSGMVSGGYCAAKDLIPPYLVNPIPEPGSVTGNWFFIKTGVADDLTGVNGDTIVVSINGAPPRVKPIIEQSHDYKGYNVTLILDEVEKTDKITIGLQAYDLAEEPNLLDDSWTFSVEAISTEKIMINTYPENYRNLSYESESGNLTFMWAAMEDYKDYRIEFTLRDGSKGTMDVTLDGEMIGNSYYLIKYELPGLSASDWNALVEIGEIEWRVAPINSITRELLMKYGESNLVTYVGENVPLLRKPPHHALLTEAYPPSIKWEAVNSPLNGYQVVFVRLDDMGNYTSDYHVIETTLFIRDFDMLPETWQKFGSGVWAWTSLGVYPNGAITNFTIQRFRKE